MRHRRWAFVAVGMGVVLALFLSVPRQEALPALPVAPAPALEPLQDGAVLKGSVKIKGEIPKRSKVRTDADPKCAAMHKGQPLWSEDYVIDPAGNVQWAFIYVKDGLGDKKFTPPKTPVILDQRGCRYDPHVFGIMVGQDLKIRNSDSLMHIIHVIPQANREWGFSQEKPGEERIKNFAAREVMVKVFCDVHPWMTAWAGVLDHPFHGVTGPDGKFTIKGLPPGKYTIEVWHEKYKSITEEVEIKGKETKTVNLLLTDKK